MRKIIFALFLFVLVFFVPKSALAHPGNTDSIGCHTCRTNCANWGLSYGEYHCHQSKGYTQPYDPISSTWGDNGTGYTSSAPQYSYPSIPSTPTCPSMSYYDSLSKSCKCYSGYVVGTDVLGNEACVSADSKCSSLLGYGAEYNSLSEKCECRYGYVFNGSKCESETTYCSKLMGLMSRYNSLSKKCECMVGYEFDGSDCVYKKTNYSYPYQYPTSSNNCPINSHESTSDSAKCECDIGFQTNLAMNACVAIPIKTNDQACQDSYGLNSKWEGTKTSDNLLNCACQIGYDWNTSRTSCVKLLPTPIPTPIPSTTSISFQTPIPTPRTTPKPTLKPTIKSKPTLQPIGEVLGENLTKLEITKAEEPKPSAEIKTPKPQEVSRESQKSIFTGVKSFFSSIKSKLRNWFK